MKINSYVHNSHLNCNASKYIFIFILNIFINKCYNIELYKVKYHLANVTLKIKGIGDEKILSNQFNSNYYPSKVYINEVIQNEVKYIYNFNKTDNYIELFWNNNNINCANMFKDCSDIYEINFPNFNTSEVKTMSYMFCLCTKLTSLNLTNFDTSNVEDISNIFNSCKLITSLNLSNFNTLKVTNMNDMFDNCINLIYLNMKNFDKIILKTTHSIMDLVPNNVFVCGDIEIILPKITIGGRKCYTIDCSDNWQQIQKRIINNNSNTCIDSCENDNIYKYEYNGKCYQNCSNGFYIENDKKYCKCQIDKCKICTSVALELNRCNKCNDNYYPKENDETNYGEYIECYKEIKGYYLDKTHLIFKKCFNTCEECAEKGNIENHNCLICNENFPFGIKKNNYYNCYINCSFYYYFDNEKNYQCTIKNKCPNEYSKLLIDKLECIKNDINYIKENIIKVEKVEKIGKNETTTNEQKMEEIQYYDIIINNVEEIFTSDNYDTSKIDKGEKEIINIDKVTIVFKTTEKSSNNTSDNLTKIDLGECETLLRNYYNISKNKLIYLKQTEIEQEGMQVKKIECDIYSKLSISKLVKLNLSVCANTKMILSVPIKISESIDKLNISSGYYNDICYTTSSDSGTDITLNDRKKQYMKRNNIIICQEGCDFSSYDYTNQEANCSCDV